METLGKNIVEARSLDVGYDGVAVLRNVNFTVSPGEVVAILGPNGGGKTTLIRTICGSLPAVGGELLVAGKGVETYSPKELSKLLALALTERPAATMMSAYDIVMMGRLPHTNFFGGASQKDHEAAERALSDVGALELGPRLFTNLSDGEKQKIIIARALAQETPLLILDEPTSHLDIKHKLEVAKILRNRALEGVSVLLSLHDPFLSQNLSDKLLLVGSGHAEEVKPDAINDPNALETLYGIDSEELSLLTPHS